MQIFLLFLFLFLFGSVLGWFIELLFRRFVSAKKWVNPGFMKGPWLPLYGFGLVSMFAVSILIISSLPSSMGFYNPLGGLFGIEEVHGPSWSDLIPIAIMWLAMNLLEFIAGLIFIKGFHVLLWDYRNMKGNILGIVCPVFSFIWLVVAIIFYYGVNPFLYDLSIRVYDYMFGDNGTLPHFGVIFALGVFYGLFIYDLVVSLGLFASISKMAKESGIASRYEEWKEHVSSITSKSRLKIKMPSLHLEGLTPLKSKIEEMVYIDPEYEHHKHSNYDESGRPKKTDE